MFALIAHRVLLNNFCNINHKLFFVNPLWYYLYDDIFITFAVISNFSKVTIYLRYVSNLDLFIMKCVTMEFSRVVCRFYVAEIKLKRPNVAKVKCMFCR